MARIWGDGIHDDYEGIQSLLDGLQSTVYLPVPEKYYVISKTLKIHSNQTLKLNALTRIRLADGSNCSMLENADFENGNKNVNIDGGIWDMNHKNQWPNPYHFENPDGYKFSFEGAKEKYGWEPSQCRLLPGYKGHCFIFYNVNGFSFKNITIENPVVYGAQLIKVSYFTIENIRFDYFEGSPKLWNLDGIHLEGYCKFGKISNLHGACHDDLLAITTDDLAWGPIENIEVDGIFAEHCHSAIRFLSRGNTLKNITVRNIYGSYYVYCIIMSRYIDVENEWGKMQNVLIENVFASISEGTIDVAGNYQPLIYISKMLDMKNIVIRNVCRDEKRCFLPTVQVDENTKIDSLTIDGIHQTSLGNEMSAVECSGDIERLEIKNIFGGKCKIDYKKIKNYYGDKL